MIANRVRMSKIDEWDGVFFADPEVGRVLHANGLIRSPIRASKKELAAITSLSSRFKNNKVITQFPELQYCTGLTSLSETFYGCSSLTKAPVIPSSVTQLYATFYGCKSLTTAPTIPEGVGNLTDTFSGCSSLITAPTIPEGVNIYMYGTFEGCSSLTTAPAIPSGVIDFRYTLNNCSSIDGIYVINAVTPPYYLSSLSNVQAIYVPNASVSAYRSESGWSSFASKIYSMSNKP